MEVSCLNHGFVRLVDVMGDDAAIVQAARVSYGAGTKKVHEDRGLIRYLLRHAHTTPFEMVEFKFHIKLPIFIARQWIRHRTANVNEISGRYSVMQDEFYIPEADQLRPQSSHNRQGRAEEPFAADVAEGMRERFRDEQGAAYAEYTKRIDEGMAREIARVNLPLSLYTEWYWKIDLHNLFHFLRLRLDDHAQYEIRVYAEAMAELARRYVPMAWEAFEDYILHSKRFSRLELKALVALLGSGAPAEGRSSTAWLEELGMSKREAREFLQTLSTLQ
jgi:thymidylate synthase (FAD)